MTNILTSSQAQELLDAAMPGPWLHNGDLKTAIPGNLWHTCGAGGPLIGWGDFELAAKAPDLAASVVALHAEVECAAKKERARIVAWLKERADKAYSAGIEHFGDALLNASRILATTEGPLSQ